MKRLVILVVALALTGCATAKKHWDMLSAEDKRTAAIAGSILIVAAAVKKADHNTNVHNCISTRSLETGCPGVSP